jgi:hypothetical protein
MRPNGEQSGLRDAGFDCRFAPSGYGGLCRNHLTELESLMPQSVERLMAKLMTIGTVGTEMVAPIGLGLLLDYFLGTMPWFMVTGAVLGLVVGIVHLIQLNKPGRP